eukprot:7703059-Alexandrium_andersonii.AAC.1
MPACLPPGATSWDEVIVMPPALQVAVPPAEETCRQVPTVMAPYTESTDAPPPPPFVAEEPPPPPAEPPRALGDRDSPQQFDWRLPHRPGAAGLRGDPAAAGVGRVPGCTAISGPLARARLPAVRPLLPV